VISQYCLINLTASSQAGAIPVVNFVWLGSLVLLVFGIIFLANPGAVMEIHPVIELDILINSQCAHSLFESYQGCPRFHMTH
jgi:hypothetical protein